MANTQNNLPNAESLARQLQQLAETHHIESWCIAYSGGVDSHVLLHLLSQSSLDLSAIYINHGLQSAANDWAEHCETQAAQLNIPFQSIVVTVENIKAQGLESAARLARYSALKEHIHKNTCLLTAQHQDDQAETVLLQLLRGAGAAGLAAMPYITEFSAGWHCRPLLEFTQAQVLAYAQQHKLEWVEDPSNQQQVYQRNFLRHSVMPTLQQNWPTINKTLSVFAQQQQENTELLQQLAELDLLAIQSDNNSLQITKLRGLQNSRLRNALRFWLKQNFDTVPPRVVLQQIVQQIQSNSHDTAALIDWDEYEVRRFRNGLFCLKKISHNPAQVIQWDGQQVLKLDSLNQQLQFETTQQGLNPDVLLSRLSIKFRQGGERIRPAGRDSRKDLKKLFQEAGVPSWQRERIPLLYANDQLIAVIGYWLSDDYVVDKNGLQPVLSDQEKAY